MKNKNPITASLLFVFSLLISGCNRNDEIKHMNNFEKKIHIAINEHGEELKNRHPNMVRVTHQPVGVSFYKIDWDEKDKGIVLIKSNKLSFEIDNVLGFTGNENDDLENEGMSQLNIISGITGPNGISHEDARVKFLEIISKLRNIGWQSTIPFSAPRFKGKDMLTYLFNFQRPTTLDASYLPSLDEWMRLPDLTTWEFYGDRTFLRVNFVRDSNKLDPKKPGAYVINFALESDINYYKGFAPPLQRDAWREILPSELKKAESRRKAIEKELVQKGLRVDETYQDPPIPK